MYRKIRTILYHGTVSAIQQIDVGLGRGRKDFGTLLNNLETENLGIQYYIGKQEVVDKCIVSIKEIDWR